MNFKKRTYALLAGVSLLLMAVTAGYAYGYIYQHIVIKGHPAETIRNLQSDIELFTTGVFAWGLIFVLDLLVAWALFRFFQEHQPKLSLATALLRVIYTAFLGMGIFYLGKVPLMIGENTTTEMVMAALNTFERIWSLGLIIFGLHLVGLAFLVIKDTYVANLFGWLLLIAGLSYFGIHAARTLFPDFESSIIQLEMILSIPMAAGELAFAVWLVIKGGKTNTY